MAADSFGLGRELAEDGRFVRQDSVFRRWVTDDGSSGFPVEGGRYHLYVSLACPWCHRTVIARVVKGLQDAVSISYADPFSDERGWAFSGARFNDPASGEAIPYDDPVNGYAFLSEAYLATDPLVRGPGNGAGALGQADGPDREQRVGRHRAHVQRRLRRHGRGACRPLPGGAARRDRRDRCVRLRQGQQRRLQGGLRAHAEGLRRRVPASCSRRWTSSKTSSPSAASCSAR